MKLFRPQPRISAATARDAAALTGLYQRAWEEYRGVLDPRMMAELQPGVEEVEVWLAGGFSIYIASLEGQMVGTIRCSFPTGACSIDAHAVDPLFRRRGVGSALVEQAMSAAHRAGAGRLWVHASPKLEPAMALYRSMGFREAGNVTAGYWGETVVLLELTI